VCPGLLDNTSPGKEVITVLTVGTNMPETVSDCGKILCSTIEAFLLIKDFNRVKASVVVSLMSSSALTSATRT
jgi:hypothetical protein